LTNSGSVVSSWSGAGGLTYSPVEGSYFAVLEAGTDDGVYSTLSQGIAMSAGESLFGLAAFDYRDYDPYDDSAYVKILDNLGNEIATPWFENGLAHPDFWDGPWTSWTWTAASTDTYFVQFGVANMGDNQANSAALFDAVGSTAPVPEPATMLLMGTGIAGLIAARRKKKA
jgi:hypothetical protein